jgi:Gas vesicle protein
MNQMEPSGAGGAGGLTPGGGASSPGASEAGGNLADVLERVLDKGIVIAGDIRVNLLDIELLTIKLRLIVASVDTARRIGINWWETDRWLTAGEGEEDQRSLRERVRRLEGQLEQGSGSEEDHSLPAGELEEENRSLREQLARLESELESTSPSGESQDE